LEVKLTSKTFWTDATCNLNRFKNDDLHHQKFERNRIARVLKVTNAGEWQHVLRDINPADLASRGFLPDDEEAWKKWRDSAFLDRPESEWPTGEDLSGHLVNCLCVLMSEIEEELSGEFESPRKHFLDELSERVSSWSRLLQIVGLCIKYSKTWLAKVRGGVEMLSGSRRQAEMIIYRHIQWQAFPYEMSGLTPKKDSPIVSLAPELDREFKVLRVGGRLARSDMSESAKHPILLPAKNVLVTNMIREAHKTHLHSPARR
jgi:hypothetical protein